jgi:hypothetical protein
MSNTWSLIKIFLQNYHIWKNWLKKTQHLTFSLMKLLFQKKTFRQKCWLKFPKKCHPTTLFGLLARATSPPTQKSQFWLVILLALFIHLSLSVLWLVDIITIFNQISYDQIGTCINFGLPFFDIFRFLHARNESSSEICWKHSQLFAKSERKI